MSGIAINRTVAPQSAQPTLTIGTKQKLSLLDLHLFISEQAFIELSDTSLASIEQAHAFLKSQIAERNLVYGINTNFGDQVRLIDPTLDAADETYNASIQMRQHNVIRSLHCGLGEQVSAQVVKITMLLRAHCLAQGYSGVSPEVLQAYLHFLNADITPIVRRYGSIGASGDLIPLGCIAAALIGEEVDVLYESKLTKASVLLPQLGIPKLKLSLRDGLAMVNGTSFMTAIASYTLYKLNQLFKQLLSAIAMVLEAMQAHASAYHALVHELKRQQGERVVSQFILDCWEGSSLILSNSNRNLNESNKSLQDYYSLRSVPQGFGPFHENLQRATEWIENEMNSVNDNPIIDVANQAIYHSANFMGYYVTTACDLLKADIAQASTWIHALLANLLHARKNHHLPTNLVADPVQHNGFRSLQLLAAAIAIQNRKLAQSQQAFMLPTEGDNQDVNSLGTHAALDFQESVTNLERLTAILFLAGTQALELRGIEKASMKAKRSVKTIRSVSAMLTSCRPMTEEIEAVIQLLSSGKIEG